MGGFFLLILFRLHVPGAGHWPKDLRFWVQHAITPPEIWRMDIQNDAIFGKRYIFQTMVFGIYVGLSLSENCWVILEKFPAPTKPPFTQSLPAAASATQPPTHPAVAMERPIGNHTVAWNERFLLVTSHRSVAAKSMITSHQPKCAILGIQFRVSDCRKNWSGSERILMQLWHMVCQEKAFWQCWSHAHTAEAILSHHWPQNWPLRRAEWAAQRQGLLQEKLACRMTEDDDLPALHVHARKNLPSLFRMGIVWWP